MIADIATGNTDLADVAFLLAMILGFVATILGAVRDDRAGDFAPVAAWAAIGCLGLGLLVL